jgi:hypothetical protein
MVSNQPKEMAVTGALLRMRDLKRRVSYLSGASELGLSPGQLDA